jgi:hypothetical protein
MTVSVTTAGTGRGYRPRFANRLANPSATRLACSICAAKPIELGEAWRCRVGSAQARRDRTLGRLVRPRSVRSSADTSPARASSQSPNDEANQYLQTYGAEHVPHVVGLSELLGGLVLEEPERRHAKRRPEHAAASANEESCLDHRQEQELAHG